MPDSVLLKLALVFAPLSVTAFCGGLAVISAMEHQSVAVHGWLGADRFLDFFAIARAAPGPGSMLATLIGWQAAGLPGALVATLAMFLPSSLLCLAVAVVWRRYRERKWLALLERAVAPIGVGLLVAGVATLAESAAADAGMLVIAAAGAAVFVLRPGLHPLVVLAAGGAAGVLLAVVR